MRWMRNAMKHNVDVRVKRKCAVGDMVETKGQGLLDVSMFKEPRRGGRGSIEPNLDSTHQHANVKTAVTLVYSSSIPHFPPISTYPPNLSTLSTTPSPSPSTFKQSKKS